MNDRAKDPVCGMEIDMAKAKAAGGVSEFQGRAYYFCFDSCKQKFARDPARYVQSHTQTPQQAGVTKAGGAQ